MDNLYCYPETNVLKNKLGIMDHVILQQAERYYTSERINQLALKPIKGNFDLRHLKAIHKYIFQDLYTWAGEVRRINISKGHTVFADYRYLDPSFKFFHEQLIKEDFLKNCSIDKFCGRFSYYASNVNMLHPFREGNGRSTREYLRCLAKNAGYDLNYSKFNYSELYDAFVFSVLDESKLKDVFKKHLLDNVKVSYSEDYMKNSPESLLSKLNDLRMMFSHDGSCIPLSELKNLYKQYGSIVESNPSADNLTKFHLISDTLNEIKSEKARDKNSCRELYKEYKKDLDMEL